ncbi:MAG: glyoxalase [Candidatus Thermoplasmatota archaeon]|nr:glyoxalase [Candidatus Thermoplasmatota archaeon]MCL5789732.1 glyoxalase [Candidatus Thermoplasmatota archaeon]
MAITPIIFIVHFFLFIPMKILFIAGFGPIPNDLVPSKKLYSEDLEIRFNEYEGGYMHARKIEGCKGFAIWPLSLAAEDCFGTKTWPVNIPVPQSWLEFEVEDVKEASEEMKRKGYRLLLDSYKEPYGQIVSRFLSPEGILLGLVYTPWLREQGIDPP